MLLTISTTYAPATDLGFLLHKNPARMHSFDLSFGKAHVFYPRAESSHCTAALLLDVDPVQLVRGKHGVGFTLDQYVNDRPYVASSLMSVAISQVFGTALSGRCKGKPELAELRIPLVARLAALPCRGGEALLRQLFEPLGYSVTATREPLDPRFPEWGEGPYYTVELAATLRLRDLLDHLYVLVPVLDDDKHYYIGEAEVEKLLKHGEAWLAGHPQREAIVRRYLGYRSALTRQALARLPQDEAAAPDEDEIEDKTAAELPAEKPLRLNDQRLDAVVGELKACGAGRVLDLGCSTGNLLRRLLDDGQFTEIVGVDVSHQALDVAARRLHLDRLPPTKANRIKLLHGSLTYRDRRLAGYDAAAIVEVIEHLDPPRLAALERAVFEAARPKTVVVTTPNREYNTLFAGMQPGQLRHRDHRFEWTRDEFRNWATRVAERFGYQLRLAPIGPEDATHGAPTQMAVFQLG
ncbi:MAG: 3' terminal RNA ribose 2'-O-methyltransferase Hen1 [Planctomycetaceae bacterium]|nr:3' terminal RNA ribose 2'-O-methyltransferase Hen1 [Planctomycetaceae bacterium]